MTMERLNTPESGNIESVSYDDVEQVLEIEFKNKKGNTFYHYFDVPEDVAKGFESATSAGKYFRDNILKVFEFAKQ